jgi:hypothetical protein
MLEGAMDGLLYMLTPDVCLFFALFYAKFKKVWIKKQKKKIKQEKGSVPSPFGEKSHFGPSLPLFVIDSCV